MTDAPAVKHKLDAHIVLDRSGSMDSVRQAAIDAVNSYVVELAKDGSLESRVSLTLFDKEGTEPSIDLVRDRMPVSDFKALTEDDFVPRGWTPLRDAIGRTIKTMDLQNLKPEIRRALIIMTDGHENASKEFTSEALKVLIQEKEKAGWLITYLGANHDSWDQAKDYGLRAAATMDFDTSAIGETMAMAATNTRAYGATGQSLSADYTATQRASAMGDIKADAKKYQTSRITKIAGIAPTYPIITKDDWVPVPGTDDWVQVGDALLPIAKSSSAPDAWAVE